MTVQATATITNANGKTATITSDAKSHTPTVVAAVPTANPATSKDIQVRLKPHANLCGKTVQVNGEDKAITIKDNSYIAG